jgi:hypothetical protein
MKKVEALGFWGLELREFRFHTSICTNLQKEKSGSFRVSGFETSRVKRPSIIMPKPMKCEKWKLRGFGAWNFASSDSIHQYAQTPEKKKRKLD